MANGGYRLGAGRPKGSKNKRTLLAEEIAAKAVETIEAELSGETMTLEQASAMSALDVLKHAMTRSIVKNDWQSTAVYARDIAPYQLAKLTSSKVDATVRRSVEDMSDDELIEFAGGVGEEEDTAADSDRVMLLARAAEDQKAAVQGAWDSLFGRASGIAIHLP